jgi:hypothetical protein
MPTEIYKALGKKRVREICKEHGLLPKDKEVLEKVLKECKGLEVGGGMVPRAMRIIGQNPRGLNILHTAANIKIAYKIKKTLAGSGANGNGHRPNSSFL